MNKPINVSFSNAQTKVIEDSNFEFSKHFVAKNSIIIVDKNVFKLYENLITNRKFIIVSNGERCKTYECMQYVISELNNLFADRDNHLIGFGGGAVCDLTGFVASIYMRGVKHSFVPTTLLSMVDASIGGKTAINHNEIKNLVGVFKHPEKVVINNNFLRTLPIEELYSGLSEVIKIAILNDRNLLQKLLELDISDLDTIDNSLILSALLNKISIVRKDEYDIGIRNYLNFGHTFGHVFETLYNIPHGIAVLEGMKIALELSKHLNLLDVNDYEVVSHLLSKIPINHNIKYSTRIFDGLLTDKKRKKSSISLILLNGIGNPVIKTFQSTEIIKICKPFLIQKYA